MIRGPKTRFALSFLFFLALGLFMAQATPASDGSVKGYGAEKFDGEDDLPRAIKESQDKARQDLSANILTYVKNVTIDKTVEENGKTQEFFKRISVTRVVQLLREVDLSRPQVDRNSHIVTTQASVSRGTAERIIQNALAKIREKEAEYNQDMARLRALTDGGKYYYKKKVETVEDMGDEYHLNYQLDELKERLIHEKLRDVQDVRNAIKAHFMKEFPRDDKVTYLVYIGIKEYKDIITNYDQKTYGEIGPAYIGSAFQNDTDPWNMPNVAEAFLPGKRFANLGFGYRFVQYAGVDPFFGIALWGSYTFKQDFYGFGASLGLDYDGGGDFFKNSPYGQAGWRSYGFHIPLEVDGYLYLHTVKSDAHIPFLKAGLVGMFTILTTQQPDTNYETDLMSGFNGGFVIGVGVSIFHKSGLSSQTQDFGLDFQIIPNGLYNEGTQVGIGAFCNWGFL